MIEDKKVLAVITAREGSKGLPGKNMRPFCGVPLVGWPIKAALESACVDRVIVSTDNAKIAAIAADCGADVPFLRPEALARDESTSVSVVMHAIEFCEQQGENYHYLVLLEPTSPLTEAGDIDAALAKLHRSQARALVAVNKVESTAPEFCASIKADGRLKPYLGERFTALKRRQEIEELYFFDGSLYISTVEMLKKTGTFYHDDTLPYIMPAWKAVEVDTLVDFVCAEALMKNRDLFSA